MAEKLAPLDKGHNKVLESMCVWLDVRMPRYWWQEFDTYRVGVTKQSESTMHILIRIALAVLEGYSNFKPKLGSTSKNIASRTHQRE
ncbi:hypothetical protein [Desulfocurvus sp.]|uniref:hypothetical protein n=1 Tax=Desulfocurvus sp. TaxID=2871698 RepID=UPI0025C63B6D|nr:hypothetical protein [Desulfocurvus sp.]MCK9240314.1 hypothetical protein [Desulfocurvus sp.]